MADNEEKNIGKREERLIKREKTEEKDVFLNFTKKETECENLLRVVTDLITGAGINPLIACPLKITQANANLTRAFSSAICMTEFYMKIDNPTKPFTINVGTLFDKGCAILMEFFGNRKVPKDEESRRALKRLINFLTENYDFSGLFDSEDTDSAEKRKKTDWCIRVAQHLFVPLSSSKQYIIDKELEGSDMVVCPSSSQDQLQGVFGDTSFGCRNLWHGKVDAIFGTVPLVFGHSFDLAETESESESETSPDRLSLLEVKFQMRAQAIVFGFYQNRHSRRNHLVPSVGITKEKIVFRFYDSLNDVLLETHAIDLCSYENSLSPHAVLLLWLTLNYKCFASETPESLKPYKSEFHRQFQSCISTYENEVVAPCHVTPLQTEKRLPKVPGDDSFDIEAVRQRIAFKSIEDL